MSEPQNEPWYRKPLPTYVPGWLILCLAMSACFAYLGYESTVHRHEPATGIRGAVIGAAIGFPVGVCFLLLVQTEQKKRQHKGAKLLPEYMMPPHWLASIVSAVSLSLIGNLMVSRRGSSFLEVSSGLMMIAASALFSIRIISTTPRRSTFAVGVVCLLISIAGFIWASVNAFYVVFDER